MERYLSRDECLRVAKARLLQLNGMLDATFAGATADLDAFDILADDAAYHYRLAEQRE